MDKLELKNLDTSIYYEKLSNGLKVFIVPNNNVNKTYVTYSTKFGSIHDSFIPYKKKDYITVPLGVAHFLEHKVFEQEDGTDPFNFFSNHGASANANTSNLKTTYLFQTTKDLKENLEYLLKFVESPYFTDENVEKEKGIIEQELLMYEDEPYNKLYETTIYNSFVKHPIKYSIGGTTLSIKKITKEDLYTCYNTFYHPSNMFLVITGKVNPDEIISIIKEHEGKRDLKESSNIKIKGIVEPNRVAKEKEVLKMSITIPKVTVAYKMNLNLFKNLNIKDIKSYINILFNLKFSDTSLYVEDLKNKGIINESFAVNTLYTDEHVLIMISNETKLINEVTNYILEGVKDLVCSEDDLERVKRVSISSQITMTDSIYRMNRKIMNNIIDYNKVILDPIDEIKKLNMNDLNYVKKNLDFSNKTITIVDSNKN